MPDISILDLARLGTFKDWKDAESRRHSPSQLSQMGFMFVYKNETGKIICTSCQFRPENIDTELDAICDQHRQFAPNCKFNIYTLDNRRKLVESANKTNNNNGLDCSSNTYDEEKFKNNLRFLNSIVSGKATFQSSTDTEDVKDVNLSTDDKFYLEKIVDKMVERLEYRCMEREEVYNDITLDSENNRPTLHPELQNSGNTGRCDTGLTSIEIQQQAVHPGLSNRNERRRTFRGQEHKYAPSNHCDIIDRLVDAGLYYVGPSDNVRCFYCDGGLKNFAKADDPYVEHKRNFPDCQYIQQPSRRITGTSHSSHYGNLLTVRDERIGESTLDGCIDARDQVNFTVRSSRRGLLQTDHAGLRVRKTVKTHKKGETKSRVDNLKF